MFLLHRPTPKEVEAFLESSRRLPLSYDSAGPANRALAGFRLDEHMAIVGQGPAIFERAKLALAEWRHFDLGWLELFPRRGPITPGSVVAVLVAHLGFWSMNGCRVVSSIGLGGQSEFGFAYGTLTNHAESGEESFKVSIDPETQAVSYTITAHSRPRAALVWLGFPVARMLQARFRRDSASAIARAIAR